MEVKVGEEIEDQGKMEGYEGDEKECCQDTVLLLPGLMTSSSLLKEQGQQHRLRRAVHVIRTIIVITRHPERATGVTIGHRHWPTWL